MGQAVEIFLPLLAFMLIPIFIPVVTSMIGRVIDVVTPKAEASPALRATEAARHAAAQRQAAVATAR